jgi:uncharacterized membrane protein YfhO
MVFIRRYDLFQLEKCLLGDIRMKIPQNILKNENTITGIFFIVIILIFFYRIFLGEVYSPTNLYYHMAPWKAVYSTDGTQGALLSDPVDALLPGIHFTKEQIMTGGLSHWNPHYAMGVPVESSFIVFLYPLILLYMILPIEVATTFYLMSKLFIAAIGMFIFLRQQKVNTHAARIGALIFTFALPMIVWLNWPHTSVSVLAPWLLWGIQKVYNGDRKFIVFTAYIIAIMLFGNMPAYVGYYLYIGGVYYLFLLVREYFRERNLKRIITKGMYFMLVIIFGIGIASVYVFTFINYINSFGLIDQRDGLFQNFFSLQYILSLLSPFYIKELGIPAMHPNEYSGYFGITSLVIFGMSFLYIFRIKNFKYHFWTALSVLCWLIVYGSPIADIFEFLPVLGSSSAIRLIGPLTFLIAIVVAYTLSNILERTKNNIHNLSLVFSISFLFILYITSMSKVTKSVLITPSLVMSFLIILFIIITLCLYYYKLISRKVFILLITLLFTFDLLKAGIDYNPTVQYDKASVNPQTESTNFLKINLNDQRFAAIGLWTLFPNTSTFYGVNDIRGHSLVLTNPRHQKFYQRIDNEAYRTATRVQINTMDNFNLLSAASVSYIISPNNVKETVYKDNPQRDGVELSPIGEITTGTVIEQTFISREENMSAISILLATYQLTFDQQMMEFTLLDQYDHLVRREIISLDQIKDNAFYKFDFDPIKDSKDKLFKIRLTSDATLGNAATQWVSKENSYDFGDLYNNGREQEGDMIFKSYFNKTIPFDFIDQKDNLYVYKNNNSLPRAYLVNEVAYIEDEDEILNFMSAGDIYTRAYVEEPLNHQFQSRERVSDKYTEVSTFNDSGDTIEIKVDIMRDMFLVLTDNYFEGWRAYINDEETKIYKTNYLFKGIMVPSGEHTITFIYEPKGYRIGIVITVISLILSFLFYYYFRKSDTIDL